MLFNEETKQIKSIYCPDNCEEGFTVGFMDITSIGVSMENGQCAEVPWFEVYKGTNLVAKVNAAHVTLVTYFEETP